MYCGVRYCKSHEPSAPHIFLIPLRPIKNDLADKMNQCFEISLRIPRCSACFMMQSGTDVRCGSSGKLRLWETSVHCCVREGGFQNISSLTRFFSGFPLRLFK